MENFAYVDCWTWVFFTIVVVVMVVFFLFCSNYVNDEKSHFIWVIGTAVAVLILLVDAFGVGKVNRDKIEAKKQVRIEKEQRKKLEDSVKDDAKNGYTIYVDGTEVEYDNIDLSKYSIKIDTKKKKIILSK